MQSAYGQSYSVLYHKHWWWRSRERILVRELRSLGLPKGAEILDVGCGDALFFPKLRDFGRVRGIEVDTSLLDPNNPDFGSVSSKPLGDPQYEGWRFDLITALDVIEHIEDDGKAVRQLVGMLNPGGHLVVTVPAFMSLWDEHDEQNQHFRRYTIPEIRRLFADLGTLRETRYLFQGLFIPKYLVGLMNRKSSGAIDQAKLPSLAANRLMTELCDWEDRLFSPVRVPFGTSVLAVLQRR